MRFKSRIFVSFLAFLFAVVATKGQVRLPTSDSFAGAVPLYGVDFFLFGSNENATGEMNEPEHIPGLGHERSLWWKLHSLVSGPVTMTTFGAVDTILAVYMGEELTGLRQLAANDDAPTPANGFPVKTSTVSFTAEAGGVYYVALAVHPGSPGGEFNLQIQGPRPIEPSNDHLANAQTLAGTNLLFSGSTFGATLEEGEPVHGWPGSIQRGSVWWNWTAPVSGTVEIYLKSCCLTPEETPRFAVYLGDEPSRLRQVTVSSIGSLLFAAFAGKNYRIAFASENPSVFEATFRYAGFSPPNDEFAHATVLTGTNVIGEGSTFGATQEPDENSNLGAGPVGVGLGSIWWNWEAPVSGEYLVDILSVQFSARRQVFTGETISNLVAAGQIDSQGRLGFNAAAGTVYHIGVGTSYRGGLGTIRFVLKPRTPDFPPANDRFANAEIINGTNTIVSGTTIAAIRESGEPDHGTYYQDRTIWYGWTAPISGTVLLEIKDSPVSPEIKVYTGDKLSKLARLASEHFGRSLTFEAVAGETYWIALCTVNEGGVNLGLSYTAPRPAKVTYPPFNLAIPLGFVPKASFSVETEGDQPIRYQWFFKGAAIPGATNATYTFPYGPEDVGVYTVAVRNDAGSDSAKGSLTLVDSMPPGVVFATEAIIEEQPADQKVQEGGTATFSVKASGSWPIFYKWYFNGAPIYYGMNSNLVLNNISAANAGEYQVLVDNNNANDVVLSASAHLTVLGLKPALSISAAHEGTVTISWNGEGTSPSSSYDGRYVLERKKKVDDLIWTEVLSTGERSATVPKVGDAGVFRIVDHGVSPPADEAR